SVDVVVEGRALEGLASLRFGASEIVVKRGDGNRCTVTIPAKTPPGVYDARAVCAAGVSSPRSFVVGLLTEQQEKESNDGLDAAEAVPLEVVVNGRIEKPGDVDCYRFTARAGQRIVLECQAERIDSQLRAVL